MSKIEWLLMRPDGPRWAVASRHPSERAANKAWDECHRLGMMVGGEYVVIYRRVKRPGETPLGYTREELDAMRGWLGDCYWTDLEKCDIDELPDRVVVQGIWVHYDGGIPQFLRDNNFN